MKEISSPAAPAVTHARLFVRDSGLRKTQLCVRFNSGARGFTDQLLGPPELNGL